MQIPRIPIKTPARGDDILTWARDAQQCFRDIRSAFGSILPARPKPSESPSPAAAVQRVAWDLVSKVGIGSPDPVTGAYSSYSCLFWPGAVGGLVPGNMFTALTVSASGTQYLVVSVTTGSGVVQAATLSISGTASSPPDQTLDAPPTTFTHTLGVFVSGTYFRVQNGNVSMTVEESLRVSDPTPSPFGLPYKSYYVWRVS
jgi:hypothetical protein